ncbi:MAG: VOC family protein [Acetobacteraceae bacterium]|nr:VOC family protein [Acetobacteraceae bacterium]
MFAVEKLHHVAIPAHDFARLQAFYVDVLGLQAHPEKSNWLRAGDGFSVHLMPSTAPSGIPRIEQHFALQVDSLHDLLAHLLNRDLTPWQASLDGQVHQVRDRGDPLDFGLGSLFITDPENNVLEFLQRDKGLFGSISS